MSRQAQKKGGKDGGKTMSAPTPTATHDIIAGKFTDYDWNVMVDADDGDDFVEEILDELMAHVMHECQQKHVENQLLPFTIGMAKDAMLQIVEWQFLRRDEGEQSCDTDPIWEEDEEPAPCLTDCWAQGSVPCQEAPLPTVVEEGSEEQHPASNNSVDEAEDALQSASVSATHTEQEQEAEVEEQRSSSTSPVETKLIPKPPLSGPGQTRRKIKWRPHRGRVQYDSLGNITESMDQMEYRLNQDMLSQRSSEFGPTPHPMETMPASVSAFMRVQHGRPPAQRDVEYDAVGNVINIAKICPDKLPTHTVKTRFAVVDPRVEEAKAELEALRHGKFSAKRTQKQLSAGSNKPLARSTPRTKTTVMTSSLVAGSKYYQKQEEDSGAMPPPMMDNMNIEPGVTVREGDRVRRGPKPLRRSDISKTPGNLVAVRAGPSNSPLVVAALLNPATPTIRPLGTSPIVPPIASVQQAS